MYNIYIAALTPRVTCAAAVLRRGVSSMILLHLHYTAYSVYTRCFPSRPSTGCSGHPSSLCCFFPSSTNSSLPCICDVCAHTKSPGGRPDRLLTTTTKQKNTTELKIYAWTEGGRVRERAETIGQHIHIIHIYICVYNIRVYTEYPLLYYNNMITLISDARK